MNNGEKYFALIIGEDGGIELVWWATTLEEAKAKAQEFKDGGDDDVYVGELLFEPKRSKKSEILYASTLKS